MLGSIDSLVFIKKDVYKEGRICPAIVGDSCTKKEEIRRFGILF